MSNTHALNSEMTENEKNTADEKLSELERFIARRFDEISMEINATSQLIDMAEEGASQRFEEMLRTLQAITFLGDGDSPANSGAELEAVIVESEEAATRILDAADRIAHKLDEERKKLPIESEQEITLTSIENDVQEILMACSFQDLTGQRIRKALESIRSIEERLTGTLSKFGIQIEQVSEKLSEDADQHSPARPEGVAKAQSQDDIDSLFD